MLCSRVSGLERYRLVGDPIDVVTGANIDEALDLKLVGPINLEWWRHYNSAHCDQLGPLGWGHKHDFQRSLEFDIDGILYSDAGGGSVAFPFLADDGDTAVAAGLSLLRVDEQTYQINEAGQPSMEFVFAAQQTQAPLKRLFQASEGHQIVFYYHSDGRLKGIVDALKRALRIDYNPRGLLTAIVLLDKENNKERTLLRYDYDEHDQLIQGTDPYRNSFAFTYDSAHRLTQKTDRRGYSVLFKYDHQGRCIRTAGEDGLLDTRLDYRPLEKRTLMTRADGGEWIYNYDDNDTLTSIIDPYGGTRQFIRNELGQVTAEIDPNGNTIPHYYDADGRQIPDASDPFEPPERSIPAVPMEWEFGFLLDRGTILKQQALPDQGAKSQIEIDSFPKAPTNWLSYNHRFVALIAPVFDPFGTLIKDRSPVGHSRRWRHDPNGNTVLYQDREQRQYVKTYTSMNLLQSEQSPQGGSTRYDYTFAGNIAKVTDPGGAVSAFVYDLKDQLIEVYKSDALEERYERDQADNLVKKYAANGDCLLKFTIGKNNRKTTCELSSGETHSFEYDTAGNITLAATAKTVTLFDYNENGQQTLDMRDGLGVKHRYFDPTPDCVTTVFNRFQIHYRFQLKENLALTITDPGGKSHTLSIAGDHIQRQLSNGTVEQVFYNADGRCVSKSYQRKAYRWLRRFDYSAEGDLLALHDSQGRTVRYEYGSDHQLSCAILDHKTLQHYQFDEAGNLIKKPGLSDVVLSTGNRLLEANGKRFEYNPRNAVHAHTEGAASVHYRYDSRDMLTLIESAEGVWQAEYDPLGRRISKSFNGQKTDFYWDGDRLAAEVKADGSLRIYMYSNSLAFTPFMFMEYDHLHADVKSGRRYFIFSDHLGTPVCVEDETGNVVWRAQIEPFGHAHIDPKSTIDMPLRFPGHYCDAETGLHYNRFRYYSPELGRYLQSDPAGFAGGVNLYAYSTNPLKDVDLLGLSNTNTLCSTSGGTNKPPPQDGFDEQPTQIIRPERWDNELMVDPNQYQKINGMIFHGWNGHPNFTVFGYLDLPPGGHKIHITIDPSHAAFGVRKILPGLAELGVPHKVVPTQGDVKNRFGPGQNQQGKVITVYVQNDAERDAVKNRVEQITKPYQDAGILKPGPQPNIRRDPIQVEDANGRLVNVKDGQGNDVYPDDHLTPEPLLGDSGFLTSRPRGNGD